MHVDLVKAAVLGVKVLAAVVGGVAIFAGVNKICNSGKKEATKKVSENDGLNIISPQPQQEEVKNDSFEDTSAKIVRGIQIGQTALNGTLNIVQSMASMASSIGRLFDPRTYSSEMLGDPFAASGYFGPRPVPASIGDSYDWRQQPVERSYIIDNRTGEKIPCAKQGNMMFVGSSNPW